MTRNKHLWRRLQSLEEDYRAIILTHDADGDRLLCPVLTPQTAAAGASTRLDCMQKEIAALRSRFGMSPQFLDYDEPRKPRVVAHALPQGKIHPVTPEDVQRMLDELPQRDLVGLTRVVLTDSRRDRHASYGSRQIKLCYPVGADWRLRLRRNEGWWEVRQFGAWIEEGDGDRYVCWDPSDLKDYVLRHLLLHEVGHHVAWLRGFGYAAAATRREEEFAESYAHRRFCPSGTTRLGV